ncbi:MAG TPA: hypothetical protein VH105_07970 [Burkholderiales bacterium]|nr:hypothetical protein [Burkholderiales bacterium]
MKVNLVLASDELVVRRPVWEALSGLFLDTDVSLSRSWRIEVLAGSPYSIQALQTILVEEVYPVCKYNLLSMAGEWAGFDPDWLERKILHHLASSLRVLRAINLGRLTVPLSYEWRATRAGIVAARQNAAQSSLNCPPGHCGPA